MKLLSYSKALYSNWLYYSPDNMLFDAGEGVSSIMGNKSFAVERVLLSHGHADHIAGLIGLVNIRNNAMGDKAKPLTVYYPKDNFHISELMNYLHRTNSNLSYQLEWKPLEPGDVVQVFGEPQSRNARHVEA
ncbi:MAG: MBL fold metallo-hydrolase, partial [Candidatus Acetothermia bacterium]